MKSKYIDCKQCGHKMTLEVYAGPVKVSRTAETIKCPKCGAENVYSGDDFGESKGADSSP